MHKNTAVLDSLRHKERTKVLERVKVDPSLMLLSITNPSGFKDQSNSYMLS